ncbi:MAG: HAD-IC family P-type ATPase [Candidatus Kapabacteria bacterium]|nr:HAD-IC family P-type ATPase [Candidatus Kapabacteria bacterium]
MPKSAPLIVAENTFTPFNLINAIVVGALVVAWQSTGDVRLIWDSFGVITVVIANTVLAIIQEARAHRALERTTIVLRAPVSVLRGEISITVQPEEVRVGDVISLQRGEAVPADGQCLTTRGAEMDVSLMTGESDPQPISGGTLVPAGAWCVAGSFTMRVTATGDETQATHIEALAKKVDLSPSPLQRRVNILFTSSFVLALVLAAIDVALSGQSIVTDVDSIRRVATLVLGMIPEGLVFFSTITFIMGIVRMARLGVTVQKLAALEGLASADVVCFDKTGTLTTNQLVVGAIVSMSTRSDEECRDLVAGIAEAINDEGRMAEALRATNGQVRNVPATAVVPFSSERKYSACRQTDGTWWVIGAPEVVLTKQHPAWEELTATLERQGLERLRTVVVATTLLDAPTGRHVDPICAVVIKDAVREDAAQTIDSFAQLGMRRVILSGDAEESVNGTLETLKLANAISPTDVFTRCTPLDKKQIISSLARTSTVVMIGDGINDLPAMKEAHVGIAMDNSAQATRTSADIVLSPSAFASFPEMINEGRRAVRIVMAVAVLFMSKNLVLVMLNALTTFAHLDYHLSPRRGALLSLLGVALPSLILATRASMTAPTRRFFSELLGKMLFTAAEIFASYFIVLTVFGDHPQITSLLVITLISSLLGRLIVIDTMSTSESLRLSLLSCCMLAALITFMILPTSIPLISIVQSYYEIGDAGLEALFPMVLSALIGLMSMLPWVFLRGEHKRHLT